jgi:TetR/AcrR family transcriptional regulator, transcriptional repressor of aconitase
MPKLSRAALDERRAHILRAAERCFAKSGFRSTTIADVKAEAGVSTGAIYTYFPNKEAMIRAILEEARDARRRQLETAMAGGTGSVAQALVLLEWTTGIFNARGQHEARLNVNLWAEALRNPRVGTLAQGALREATEAASSVVAASLEAAGLTGAMDAETAGSLLIAVFLGLEVQSAVGVRLDPSEVARALATFFADFLPRGADGPPVKKRPQRRRRSAKS